MPIPWEVTVNELDIPQRSRLSNGDWIEGNLLLGVDGIVEDLGVPKTVFTLIESRPRKQAVWLYLQEGRQK